MGNRLNVKRHPLHDERGNTKLYDLDGDHRVYHPVCDHTRFWDKVFPFTGTCMDCGATIELGSWVVLPDDEHPHLSDDELRAERERYNEFWAGSHEP